MPDYIETLAGDLVTRNYIRRVRMTCEIVETWKIDHRNAMFAYDIEFLVNDVIGAAGQAEAIVGRFRQRAASDEIADYFTEANLIIGLLCAVLKSCQVARCLGAQAECRGYTIKRIDELDDVIDLLNCLLSDVKESWPTIDEATLNLSRMNYEAGNSKTAEEILNELQGSRTGKR